MRPVSNHETEHCPNKFQSAYARRRTVSGLSRFRGRAARVAALVAFFSAVLTILHTSHAGPAPAAPAAAALSATTAPSTARSLESDVFGLLAAAPFQLPSESITTYADDCQTPKDDFTLGDTICVKATVPFALLLGRHSIKIVGPANVVRDSAVITDQSLSQTLSFTIPTAAQTIMGNETFDNRGTWRADLTTLSASRRASAFFDVSGSTAAADLQVLANIDGNDTVPSGDPVSITMYVLNIGPDPAANVVVTPPSHAGLSLQSFVYASDPNNACNAPCTIQSLGRRAVEKFIATYNVTAPEGTKIIARGSVTSDTQDPRPTFDFIADTQNPAPPANTNVASVSLTVSAGANPGTTCTLTCPGNVVATANTTVNGHLGAHVTYGAASGLGDCGAISNSALSGSFFAVGTHTINSSSETGGGSCSFTVKVLDTPAPTISCPANKSATDTDSSGEETVIVGTPTFTASGGGTVTGLRSDSTAAVLDSEGNVITPAVSKPLTDPYPVGLTSILWTVTDADGRTTSCTQTVTVSDNACGDDTTPPTITAPADVTVQTGTGNTGCTVTLDDELGQAVADDNCSVTVTISGVPAGNNFAPGTYTLTYTATDAAGNTATDTQVVTVTETTTPVIFAPADASYTCLTDVPAASPSQAGGPLLDPTGLPLRDDGGNYIPGGQPFDNCGTPTVTVTETSSGAGTAASPKVILRTFTAKDASNNTSSAVQTITVIDQTPPTISCPSDITVYLPLNSTATSTVVNYTPPVGTDDCANATTAQTAGLASGASFPVGTTTNTFKVTDAVGNTAECSFTVTVLYNFSGFFQPVANAPTFNSVNAGKAIPVKFSLSGNKGLNIFPVGTPDSQQIACDSGAPVSEIEDTVNAGTSSLSYDAATDQYIYVWKTQSSWAGTCRKLVITLNDGTTHIAYFTFR